MSEVDKQSVKKILLVSYYCPTRAHAGGLRILDIYKLIRDKQPNVQLDLLTYHRPMIDWSLDDVHAIFHNVYMSKSEKLTPVALHEVCPSSKQYDVIDLQFHEAGLHIEAFRKIGKKIIFTPMESLVKAAFLKLKPDQFVFNKGYLRNMVNLFRRAAEEIGFSHKVDEVICVSKADASFLNKFSLSSGVSGLDTGLSQLEFSEPLASGFTLNPAKTRRCNVLYVAYFGSESNVIALKWYLDNVHKKIKKQVPEYVLTVVGRGDLSEFASYNDDSIEFIGEVPMLAPYVKEAGVGIAPALFGSGFRGKVNQYAIFGIPSVVSPISAKGLAYRDGTNIFIAEKPDKFAEDCIKLLTDKDLNDRAGNSARELCLKTYTWQSKWPAIRKIYELDGAVE